MLLVYVEFQKCFAVEFLPKVFNNVTLKTNRIQVETDNFFPPWVIPSGIIVGWCFPQRNNSQQDKTRVY